MVSVWQVGLEFGCSGLFFCLLRVGLVYDSGCGWLLY